MLHELKEIVRHAKIARKQGIKLVFVSVVALEGSSYRRPGVRMLVMENGAMVGAVSGGCVEKEVVHQAQSVFEDGTPKVMVYDGRYRLGCEGILHILIEPFEPNDSFFEAFERQQSLRKAFTIESQFSKSEENKRVGGSRFIFSDGTVVPMMGYHTEAHEMTVFSQQISAGFRLLIIGCEHDAVQLSHFASLTGWEVTVIAPPDEVKSIDNFPGATAYWPMSQTDLESLEIDMHTAVVVMTHSYAKDLKYLSALRDKELTYLGLLGPSKRKEKLLNQLMELYPDMDGSFFDTISGPSGINIGAETPQEIVISILAEILAVVRKQQPMPLKDKKGGIHQ
ncbi:MAG: XdhC family protein [Bacteroidota bacterium]